jgi:hypothetical protein
MAKVVMDVEVKTESAINNVDDLKDSIEDVGKETQNVAEESSEMGNQLDAAAGGAITKFKGLVGTLGGVVKSFKTLRGAIIATGIGALILAIGAVGAAFTNSEEGQNKFSKIMMQIGVVTGNVIDILANLGKGIMSLAKIFSDPAAALQGFKDGIGDAVNGIKNFNEETKKEIKLAGKLADQYAEADRAERALLVSRAKANRDRAELLEKAIDKENFTTAQRIGFLEEAGALEEKITNQEIQAARLRFKAKQQENTLSGSTKEDLLEEEQLRARLIDLETAKLTKAKEVTSQIIALKAEEAAALKAIRDEEAAKIKEAQDAQDAKDKERDDRKAKEKADAKQKSDQADAVALKEKQDAEAAALDLAATQRDNTLNAIISLAGEGSKVGKAAALAQATISGIQGVQAAFTTASASPITAAFPAYPFIQAGIAGAFALKTIKSIVSSKKPSSSSGGGGGGGTAPAASQAPSFNVVGASDTNQLAQAIGEDSKKPVKAFVVSGDVSTAQSLDRNIVEGASIG